MEAIASRFAKSRYWGPPIYFMRQSWYRKFDLRMRQTDYHVGNYSARQLSDQLRRDGVVILPRYWQGEQLRDILTEKDRLFEQHSVIDDKPSNQVIAVHEPYLHSMVLMSTAFDPLLWRIAQNYFSNRVHLWNVAMYRIEAVSGFRGGSFQWHHDSKGKQLKMMLLLTDVGEEGQRMAYLLGSHKAYRFSASYEDTRFEKDETLIRAIDDQERVLQCVGPAGTLVIFDTNGLHSGNRNQSGRRDVLINVFHAKRPRQPIPIDPAFTQDLQEDEIRLLGKR